MNESNKTNTNQFIILKPMTKMIQMKIGVRSVLMAVNWCAAISVRKCSIKIVIFQLYPHYRTRVRAGSVYFASISMNWQKIITIKIIPMSCLVLNCKSFNASVWNSTVNTNKVYTSESQNHQLILLTMKLFASKKYKTIVFV